MGTSMHQTAYWKVGWASAIMAPQSLVGRSGPRPMKERPAMVRTTSLTESAARVIVGPATWGSR